MFSSTVSALATPQGAARFAVVETGTHVLSGDAVAGASPGLGLIREAHKLVLANMTPEERLKGLPPDEVLKRYDPEERLKGLDPATIEAWLTKQRRDH
ncbi:hypothetical protein [Halochromatium sp.]